MTGLVRDYVQQGALADRPAVPSAPTNTLSFYFAQDDGAEGVMYFYNWSTAEWETIAAGGGGGSGGEVNPSDTVSVSLINSWIPFGSGYGSPLLTKNGRTVTITGLLKGGSGSTVAFVLPVGWRPAENQQFAVATSGGATNVDVLSNGDFKINSYSAYVGINVSFTVPEADQYSPEIGGGGGGGMSPFWETEPVPPDLSDFTVQTPGSYTAGGVQTSRGISLHCAGVSGDVNRFVGIGKTPPAEPWTATVLLGNLPVFRHYTAVGLYIRDNTTGRIQTFVIGFADSLFKPRVINWNGYGNYTGDASGSYTTMGFIHTSPVWLRLVNDGTNLSFYMSHDGEFFTNLGITLAKGSYVASIGSVGVCLMPNQTQRPQGVTEHVHIFHFDVSPGV